jgi:hypothetical protein
MNKNQGRNTQGMVIQLMIAILASFALIKLSQFPATYSISHIPKQSTLSLILFTATLFIIGSLFTLTIALARHIIQLFPATGRLTDVLAFQGLNSRTDHDVQAISRDDGKKRTIYSFYRHFEF